MTTYMRSTRHFWYAFTPLSPICIKIQPQSYESLMPAILGQLIQAPRLISAEAAFFIPWLSGFDDELAVHHHVTESCVHVSIPISC